MREISFISAGVQCAAWHLPAAGEPFAGERGRAFAARCWCRSATTTASPAGAARAAASKAAHAQLRGYPVDHFDVYAGEWQERALGDQLKFLHSEDLVPALTPSVAMHAIT